MQHMTVLSFDKGWKRFRLHAERRKFGARRSIALKSRFVRRRVDFTPGCRRTNRRCAVSFSDSFWSLKRWQGHGYKKSQQVLTM